MRSAVAEGTYLLPPVPGSWSLQTGEAVEIDPATERRTNPASMEFLMQPISSRTLLEEVNENNIPMSPLQYQVTPPPAVELPTTTTSSADAQICAAQIAPEAGSGDKPQASENSIEQIDPKTPGWSKRFSSSTMLT